MAEITPFAALRYDTARAGTMDTLCCPPYDIIPPDRQKALEAKNPYNTIRLERPLGEDCYRRAGALLRTWQEKGILKQDAVPAYYVYRMDFAEGKSSNEPSMTAGKSCGVYGFFARVHVEPFGAGVILPHEETLSRDKTDRFSLLSEIFCNISPIYGLYEDHSGRADQILRKAMAAPPDVCFPDGDGVTHSLWTLCDPASLAVLTQALAGRRILIADGHHRYETSLAFYEEQKQKKPDLPPDSPLGTTLMLLTEAGHPGLVVWPTHRLVCGLPGFSSGALLEALAGDFDCETGPAGADLPRRLSERPNTVGLYAGGDTVTMLTLREPGNLRRALPGKSQAYCALEVSLLHTLILEPHLGINKERLAAQTNLIYTRSLEDAYEGVRNGAYQCAFILPPTPVSMIGHVAAHGERMPQKSTYFHPKPTTGLVIHSLTL